MSCLHCAESTGQLVVAWGAEVVIFEPSSVEEASGSGSKGQRAGLSQEVSEISVLYGNTSAHIACFPTTVWD